ncbi:MAG: NUDIX domain-containing protein [Anaerolineae bacterium]|nr:NUDIX domain-containing protein [Anaerolineae bacterium]MDW8101788.1 NUDIX domain-containing protein [Anaerolineae bacterium]
MSEPIREAGAIVFWGKNVVLRKNKNGHWLFPKGHIEEGERPEETAVREVSEELGLRVELKRKVGEVHYFYDGKEYQVEIFLAHVLEPTVEWESHAEHDAFLLTPEEALKRLSFKEYSALLEKALEVGPVF